MLLLILTFHQAMPSFLDFMFPFGRQLHGQDFQFGGFRSELRLSSTEKVISLPTLGRSGRGYRMCYSFRSIEDSKSQSQKNWPWSMRQTSIYHAFDVESGRTTWIVVKGSELIRDRVKAATSPDRPSNLTTFESPSRALAASLATHLKFCDWSAENWRWYLNFLSEKLQQKSRRALSTPISPPLAQFPENHFHAATRSRATTWSSVKTKSWKLTRAASLKQETWPWTSLLCRYVAQIRRFPISAPANEQAPKSAASGRIPPELPPFQSTQRDATEGQEFFFSDLQTIQHIEERANEALLTVKVNNDVMEEIKDHYQSCLESQDCPVDLTFHAQVDFLKFKKRIISVQKDLKVQQSRAEALLRQVADRKSLVSSNIGNDLP